MLGTPGGQVPLIWELIHQTVPRPSLVGGGAVLLMIVWGYAVWPGPRAVSGIGRWMTATVAGYLWWRLVH